MRPNNFVFFLTLAAFCAGVVSAHADTTLWYNGDYFGVGGTLSGGGAADEISSNQGYDRAYDDFSTSGLTWDVTSIWCNCAMRITGVTQASWEIRSGMAPGYGGTIVASGLSAATQTPTGRYINLQPEYAISVSGLNLYLAPGTYWLNVAPLVGNDPGTGGYLDSYASYTTGANAVDPAPGSNANGLLDWTDSYSPFMSVGYGISMGVAGTVVPEPSGAWLVLAGIGFWAYVRRYREGSPSRPFGLAFTVPKKLNGCSTRKD
jgi:hypothetical protein